MPSSGSSLDSCLPWLLDRSLETVTLPASSSSSSSLIVSNLGYRMKYFPKFDTFFMVNYWPPEKELLWLLERLDPLKDLDLLLSLICVVGTLFFRRCSCLCLSRNYCNYLIYCTTTTMKPSKGRILAVS